MGQKISEKQMKEEIRSVVRQNIKEVTTNDWHYKAIMSIWDKGGSFTRKKIGAVLCGDPKADRRDVEDALRNSGYDEVTDVTDRLRIEGVITEGEDNIPGGLAKGMTLNDIAEKHGVSVDMLVAEFKKGIQTEMEHTTDREMAKEITMDHLFEDPQYYTKLSSVEEYVDDKGVEHVAAALPQTEEEPIKEEESEETLRGLKEMAMGDLERIVDYAKMILERMGSGQELDSWMYSQITLAVDQLNSVHDTMDGNDGIKESINEGAKRFYELDYGNSKYVIQYYDGVSYHSIAGTKQDAYSATPFLNKSQAEKFKKELLKKGYREDDRMRKESVNELTYHEKQIRDGNPNNVFYVFYKGQFEAIYSAMGPRGLFDMYWDKFKVRRPAGSKFKLNPEFVIVPKKEYDNSTSNHYAKLKPYVDKFWDKLQNESVNEDKVYIDYLNKQKGFKQDRIKFNSYEEAVKWARKNFEKFNPDMIKYESVNEGSLYSSQQLIQKLTPKIEKDVELLKKEFPNYDIQLVKNRYERDGSYTLSISGKNTSTVDNNKLQKVIKAKIKESVNEAVEPEVITQIKTIAKNHQHDVIVDPKSGKKMKVDAFSASAIATVYDALSSSSKEKFLASGLLGMQQMAMKLLKR